MPPTVIAAEVEEEAVVVAAIHLRASTVGLEKASKDREMRCSAVKLGECRVAAAIISPNSLTPPRLRRLLVLVVVVVVEESSC